MSLMTNGEKYEEKLIKKNKANIFFPRIIPSLTDTAILRSLGLFLNPSAFYSAYYGTQEIHNLCI